MAFRDEFTDLCVMEIAWLPVVSVDGYGKPTYATSPTVFSPNVAPYYGGLRFYKTGRKNVAAPGAPGGSTLGQLVESEIYILDSPAIKMEDKVYVVGDPVPDSGPDGYPPIISIEQPADETGEIQYTKVSLGSGT